MGKKIHKNRVKNNEKKNLTSKNWTKFPKTYYSNINLTSLIRDDYVEIHNSGTKLRLSGEKRFKDIPIYGNAKIVFRTRKQPHRLMKGFQVNIVPFGTYDQPHLAQCYSRSLVEYAEYE